MQRRIKRISFSVCTMLVLTMALNFLAWGEEKRSFTPEDLLNQKRLSDPQIFPSGDWVAFVLTQFDQDQRASSDIWLVSKDGKVLKQLTKNPGPDTAPRWSPDGKALAFLSRSDGDKFSQVYSFSLDDGKTKRLTNEKADIQDLKWSPDKKMIAFLMADPPTEEDIARLAKKDDAFVINQDIKHTRLWLLDAETCSTRLLTHQGMTIWHFNWSPDSKKLVILASPIPTAEGNEYQSHLGLIDIASGKETILCQKTNAQASPSYSPDGKMIVFMGPVGNFKERGIIKVIPGEGGEPIELLKEYGGNVWDVTWHPVENRILAALAIGLRHHLASVDLKGQIQLLFEMNHSMIPYWARSLSVSQDGKSVAFLSERLDCPKEIWISATDGSGKKQLTNFNDYLRGVNLGSVEEVRWKNSRDGSEVDGILVKPINFQAGTNYPLIVLLHGGPAYNWSPGVQIDYWSQLFASQGYMAFLPNFRGSSGKGMKWMMANVQDWGESPMGDVMSGVDYLIHQGWADKNRLYIGGASYGGYLTSWIVTHTARFRAAYVAAGVSDLATEYAVTDEPSFLVGYFNSAPYDNPEIYRKNSPISFASQAKTPVLIVHGENDLRVPISQAYQFYSALKHFGAPVEMVVYPREFHGVREYVHQIDVMNRVLNWFKKYSQP